MPRALLGKLLVDLADSVPYRQSTRLPVVLPIKITGKDRAGQPFEELTQTIDVSKQGIRTSTYHRLASDTLIAVFPGTTGKDRTARVVWQTPNGSAEERTELGIEFTESLLPQNMWALGSVPEDWLDGQLHLSVSQKLEYFWARMKDFPVSSELKAIVCSTESPADTPGNSVPAGSDLEIADSLPPASPIHAATEDQGNNSEIQFESAHEPEIIADKPIPETATSLQDSASEEGNLPKTVQGQLKPAAEILSHSGQARKNFPDLNWLVAKLGEQAEVISKGVDHSLNSVRVASQDALDRLRSVQKEIESDLRKVRDEYENRLAEHENANAQEYRQQVEASLSQQSERLRQMEVEIQNLRGQFGPQSSEGGASNEKENREAAVGLLAEFRSELGEALREFRAAIANETEVQLRRGSASLREISANEQRELQLKSAALKQGPESIDGISMQSEKDSSRSRQGPAGAVTILALLMALATILCAFAFVSTQPKWQLRAQPPAEFLNTNADGSLRPDEEAQARAYWECAVQVIQKTYSFGRVLPADPPPEFAIQPPDAARVHSKTNGDASRLAYWQKLRRIWGNPQAWEETYEWNTDWLFSPLKSLGMKLRG